MSIIGISALLYFFGAVLYRLEVKASMRCASIWPFCFLRDVVTLLFLYKNKLPETQEPPTTLHPWHSKRVIVADVEKNKSSSYWCPLIGRQGKVIASFGDELITVWLDGEAVPNEQVLTERFVLL